jgi:hypothetical protein
MHPRFQSLSNDLATRSPIDVDGLSFVLTVAHIHEPPLQPGKAVVILHATHDVERYIGELHVSSETLARADLVEIAVRTMERIIRDDLPPLVGE